MNKIKVCLLVIGLIVFTGCQKNTGGVNGSDCGCSNPAAEADKKIIEAEKEYKATTEKAVAPVVKAQKTLVKEKTKAADKVIEANDELIKKQAEALSEAKAVK